MAVPSEQDTLVTACRVGDVPPGWVRKVDVGERVLAIANVDGEFFALDHYCSHASGPLGDNRLSGCALECPWHGSVFDVRFGGVQRGPARKPQTTYPVTVRDGAVLVTLP